MTESSDNFRNACERSSALREIMQPPFNSLTLQNVPFCETSLDVHNSGKGDFQFSAQIILAIHVSLLLISNLCLQN